MPEWITGRTRRRRSASWRDDRAKYSPRIVRRTGQRPGAAPGQPAMPQPRPAPCCAPASCAVRRAPARSSSRISRSTVHRATVMPSRFSCSQTFRAPRPRSCPLHPADRGLELLIPHRPGRGRQAGRVVMGGRGDLAATPSQHAADRSRPRTGPYARYEPHEDRCGRSSSEKKAEAALRISLARRSSRTSPRSLRSSADSSLVTPNRVPPSTSAWRTRLRCRSPACPRPP